MGLPPMRVRRKVDVTRNDLSGWPIYEISPKFADSTALKGQVLYLHGDGYFLDLPVFFWPMTAKLSVLLGRNVTLPIYPLAPEHTYRNVYPFLLNVCRRILQQHDPKSVVLMGDSAGGCLALGSARFSSRPEPT